MNILGEFEWLVSRLDKYYRLLEIFGYKKGFVKRNILLVTNTKKNDDELSTRFFLILKRLLSDYRITQSTNYLFLVVNESSLGI